MGHWLIYSTITNNSNPNLVLRVGVIDQKEDYFSIECFDICKSRGHRTVESEYGTSRAKNPGGKNIPLSKWSSTLNCDSNDPGNWKVTKRPSFHASFVNANTSIEAWCTKNSIAFILTCFPTILQFGFRSEVCSLWWAKCCHIIFSNWWTDTTISWIDERNEIWCLMI